MYSKDLAPKVSSTAKSLIDNVKSFGSSVRAKAREHNRDRLKASRDAKRKELFKQYGVK